jgi:hypothetical protein
MENSKTKYSHKDIEKFLYNIHKKLAKILFKFLIKMAKTIQNLIKYLNKCLHR